MVPFEYSRDHVYGGEGTFGVSFFLVSSRFRVGLSGVLSS